MKGQTQSPQIVVDDAQTRRRAATYMRMSTEHQQYSVEFQTRALESYAAGHNLVVVKKYVDAGRSGLSLTRRDALQRLLEIVVSGRADFSVILVYDVSRWGRFQDADEAAHYEFICRKSGVQVKYCAEQFADDASLPSTVFKGLKRAMAAEFSRELSTKVSQAMKLVAMNGYFHGGFAPYGTRRLLIDEHNNARMLLNRGQSKLLKSDRVILVPGPDQELEAVRSIFRMFALDRTPRSYIANKLNQAGLPNTWGNPWSHNNVLRVLRDQIYVGRLVYNKTSRPLDTSTKKNPKSEWIIKQIFEPIIDPDLFETAQRILNNRWTYSDNELLDFLSATLCAHGKVTSKLLNALPGPSITTYFDRFGRLSHTLKLIGYLGCRSNTYTGDPQYHPKRPDVKRYRETSKWRHYAFRYRS